MKSTYYIDEARNLVVVEKVGAISVDEDIAQHKSIIKDPKFRKGLNSLIDMTKANYEWGLQDIDRFRTYLHAMAKEIGPRKWALVSDGGITQANAKLFVVLHDLQPHGLAIKLFPNKFDAIKWLSNND